MATSHSGWRTNIGSIAAKAPPPPDRLAGFDRQSLRAGDFAVRQALPNAGYKTALASEARINSTLAGELGRTYRRHRVHRPLTANMPSTPSRRRKGAIVEAVDRRVSRLHQAKPSFTKKRTFVKRGRHNCGWISWVQAMMDQGGGQAACWGEAARL